MADVISSAPSGFVDACSILNNTSCDVISEICQTVVYFLQNKSPSVDLSKIQQKLDQVNCSLSKESTQSLINAVTYIYQYAAKNKLTVQQLTAQLSSHPVWNVDSIQAVTSVWKLHGESLIRRKNDQSFTAGQLIDFKWKLGIAMGSNSCKNLNLTYVAVNLKVADSSGKVTSKSFELTIPEFQNFAKELKNMGSVLETV